MSTLAMLAAHSPPRADPDSPLALYRKSEERLVHDSMSGLVYGLECSLLTSAQVTVSQERQIATG